MKTGCKCIGLFVTSYKSCNEYSVTEAAQRFPMGVSNNILPKLHENLVRRIQKNPYIAHRFVSMGFEH